MSLPPPQRVLALLAAAGARGGELTVDEAARVLGVGRDDLPRVVGEIGAVGVPPFGPEDLVAIGLEGDWVVVEPFQPLGGFGLSVLDGATLLACAEHAAATSGPEAAGRYRAAADALRAALGDGAEEARHRARTIAWAAEPVEAGLVDRLTSAVRDGTAVRVRFWNASRDVVEERAVRPVRVVQHGGRWYASCETDRGHRYLRLDRVLAVEPTDDGLAVAADVAAEEPEHRRGVLFDAPDAGVVAEVAFDEERRELAAGWFSVEVGDDGVATLAAPTLATLHRDLVAFGHGWRLVSVSPVGD